MFSILSLLAAAVLCFLEFRLTKIIQFSQNSPTAALCVYESFKVTLESFLSDNSLVKVVQELQRLYFTCRVSFKVYFFCVEEDVSSR